MDIHFTGMDWLGSALIVATVALLAMEPKKNEGEKKEEPIETI